MASHSLTFLGSLLVVFLHCLLMSTEAFPSVYYLADDKPVPDSSVVDVEKIPQFPISLHGYGIPNEGQIQDSITNKIKEKLLRLNGNSLHGPMKWNHVKTDGYRKRQQDWFATYGKRSRTFPHAENERPSRQTFRKRQNGWVISYGRK